MTRWQRLTEPHPSVGDLEVRQAAALTATLCTVGVPLAALTLATAPPLFDADTPYLESPLVWAGALVTVFMLAAYFLARSRWPHAGIQVLPWGTFVGTWFLILTGEGTPWEAAADFLFVGAALAALTLRPRASVFAWLANFAAFAAFVAYRSTQETTFEVQDRAVTLILLGIVPPVLIVGQSARDRLHRTVAAQSHRLREGGKEFAALIESGFRREAAIDREASLAKFRSDLMNMVAHELKNPLTPIRLQMAVLQTMPASADPVKRTKAFGLLERNVDRLNEQIDHMLEASRLESGNTKLAVNDVDLARLVSEAADSYQPVAGQAGLQLVLDATGTAAVRADAARIAQVVDNLLSNAVKYTPAPGRVDVSVRLQDERASVRVRDSGLGLTAEQQAKLFQPLSNVHKPVRSNVSSTGLGLFISKGIVELHGGRMGVDSAGPGQGSTFWFDLPAGGPGPRPTTPSAAPPPAALAAGRIPVDPKSNIDPRA